MFFKQEVMKISNCQAGPDRTGMGQGRAYFKFAARTHSLLSYLGRPKPTSTSLLSYPGRPKQISTNLGHFDLGTSLLQTTAVKVTDLSKIQSTF